MLAFLTLITQMTFPHSHSRSYIFFQAPLERHRDYWPTKERLGEDVAEFINEIGALTWICTTNLNFRKVVCRVWLHLESGLRRATIGVGPGGSIQIVVSAAGLAPARVGLKIRLLELLCIHGHESDE